MKHLMVAIICSFIFSLPASQKMYEVFLYMPCWVENPFADERVDLQKARRDLLENGIELKMFNHNLIQNNTLILTENQFLIVFDIYTLFESLNIANCKNRVFLFAWETPVVAMKGYLKNIKNLFEHYYTIAHDITSFGYARKTFYPALLSYQLNESIPFKDKKFMVAVYGDKNFTNFNSLLDRSFWFLYNLEPTFFSLIPYRKAFIKYFSDKGLDLYGNNWDIAYYHCYKGPLGIGPRAKIDFIKDYKFVVALENTGGLEGYISEKIFDPMLAGSVPIYANYNNVDKLIPKECFIDTRDFDSLDALYNYLITMSEDRYNKYLEAIKSFLKSKEADTFRIDAFINFVKSVVFSD